MTMYVCVCVTVRMYDVNTFQCFVGRNPNDQHDAALTCVSADTPCNVCSLLNMCIKVIFNYFYRLQAG